MYWKNTAITVKRQGWSRPWKDFVIYQRVELGSHALFSFMGEFLWELRTVRLFRVVYAGKTFIEPNTD